jgi:sterol 14-demethylase
MANPEHIARVRQPTPPAMPGLPVLGNLLEFNRDRYGLLQRGYDTLGPIFSLRLGPKRAAVLIGPTYHQVFFEETDHILSMGQAYKFLVPMFGEPVGVTAAPEDYQEQRAILLELFKSAKMEGYVQVMAQEVQAWLETLGESGTFEVVESCQRLAQQIAAHAFLGSEFRQHLDEPFWHLFHDLVAGMDAVLPPSLPLPRFLRRDRARRQMHAMIRPLIAERRGPSGKHHDFLQTLVEARYADGRPLTEALIVSFIISLMFAGHETTAGQASWGLIQLLQHPDYLRVVLEEQAHALPRGQPITLETLRHVPHLIWALRETERTRPAAGLLMRYTVEPYEVGGYHVPAGWLTLISPYLAHRLPEVFHEPAHYDPWRFAPDRAEDRQHRFALVGFGGGVHKCMGMNFATNEMAVLITLLLQQYHLELLTPDPHPRREKMRAARPTPCWIRYQRR